MGISFILIQLQDLSKYLFLNLMKCASFMSCTSYYLSTYYIVLMLIFIQFSLTHQIIRNLNMGVLGVLTSNWSSFALEIDLHKWFLHFITFAVTKRRTCTFLSLQDFPNSCNFCHVFSFLQKCICYLVFIVLILVYHFLHVCLLVTWCKYTHFETTYDLN